MKTPRRVCVCLVLLACLRPCAVRAQTIAEADRLAAGATRLLSDPALALSPDNLRAALRGYEQALVAYTRAGVYGAKRADLHAKAGAVSESLADYGQALRQYRAALGLWNGLKTERKAAEAVFTLQVYMGQVFLKTERYDSAMHYCLRAEGQLRPQLVSENIQRLYNVMGAGYYQNGNYAQSLRYFEKAYQIAEAQKIKFPQQLGSYLLNIASSAQKLQLYGRALEAYNAALRYNYIPETTYRKLGETYLKLNRLDSARYFLEKSAAAPDTANRLVAYNHLGHLHLLRGEHAEALAYFNRSIALNRRQGAGGNTRLAASYAGVGQVQEARRQYAPALASYQAALHTLHFTFRSADVYQNPADLENVVSRLDFYKVLGQKAAAFKRLYNQTRRIPDLAAALQTYQAAIRLAEQLRLSYDTDEAKLFFSQQVFPVYEQAVTAAFGLFERTGRAAHAELAFSLSEKSKAAVLAETLRGLQISQQEGMPAALLAQERELRRTITKLTVASMEARDSAATVLYRDQIRDQEINLSRLVKKLDANEKYYQLKYNQQPVNVVQLQKRVLDRNTALVEYFFGDSAVYAFVVTKAGLQAFRLAADAAFRHTLRRYKTSLFEHHFSPRQPEWAHQLHKVLVAPLQAELAGHDKLIIVPDGELCYLPFESLVPDAGRRRYLLHQYTVRYGYSGTLLAFARRHTGTPAVSRILAMAPFAGKSGGAFRSMQISPLPASKDEVEKIGGRVFLESAATKEVFLKMASQYGILHLATHAKADSRTPLQSYITFYPQDADSVTGYRLYTSELYNLHLDNVKLVVLSACETGGGQLVRGEGVMSLARAFAYAGCPNIAMTLWRAEDQATARITTRMYDYLRRGYDKDEALGRSKRDYLDEAPSARRHPYFWANVVLVGDDAPVYPSYRPYWVGGLLALAAGLAGWLLWRRRRAAGRTPAHTRQAAEEA